MPPEPANVRVRQPWAFVKVGYDSSFTDQRFKLPRSCAAESTTLSVQSPAAGRPAKEGRGKLCTMLSSESPALSHRTASTPSCVRVTRRSPIQVWVRSMSTVTDAGVRASGTTIAEVIPAGSSSGIATEPVLS